MPASTAPTLCHFTSGLATPPSGTTDTVNVFTAELLRLLAASTPGDTFYHSRNPTLPSRSTTLTKVRSKVGSLFRLTTGCHAALLDSAPHILAHRDFTLDVEPDNEYECSSHAEKLHVL
uniref:Uncharacterized protein n=1 Tax=Panagrellus redivivus TaxID=6233 RepID=A0A7E4VTX3_PANRE